MVSLATEITRLSNLAKEVRLSAEDIKGGTMVVSNIGSIGGHTVAPVILSPMTAITALGRAEEVPVFERDDTGVETIVKKYKAIFSWSADHRIHDGATVARCAQRVASWLENIDSVGVYLK